MQHQFSTLSFPVASDPFRYYQPPGTLRQLHVLPIQPCQQPLPIQPCQQPPPKEPCQQPLPIEPGQQILPSVAETVRQQPPTEERPVKVQPPCPAPGDEAPPRKIPKIRKRKQRLARQKFPTPAIDDNPDLRRSSRKRNSTDRDRSSRKTVANRGFTWESISKNRWYTPPSEALFNGLQANTQAILYHVNRIENEYGRLADKACNWCEQHGLVCRVYRQEAMMTSNCASDLHLHLHLYPSRPRHRPRLREPYLVCRGENRQTGGRHSQSNRQPTSHAQR